MNKTFTFVCLLSAFAATAQTNITTESFNGINATGTLDIEYVKNSQFLIEISGDTSNQKNIEYKVSNQTLHLSGYGKSSEDLKIKVHAPSLNNIELSGASDLSSKDTLSGDAIHIKTNGAGDIKLNIKSEKITAITKGAGDITLSGSCKTLIADVSGAGNLRAYSLAADTVKVDASGAGDAKVSTVNYIKANVSGAGSIVYKGAPTERVIDISGAGSVRQADPKNQISINFNDNSDNNQGDTTRVKLGRKKLIIVDGEKEENEDTKKSASTKSKNIWSGIDFGINGFSSSYEDFDMPIGYSSLNLDISKSFTLGINIIEKNLRLYKNNLALTTGLGVEFNRYAFDNNISIANDTNKLYIFPTPNISYKKNFLKTSSISVPLLVKFVATPEKKRSFHLAAGVIGQYQYSSYLKQVFESGPSTFKNKTHDDFNLNKYHLNATVRVGYGNFNIFATYGLNDMFTKTSAPQMHTYSLGVTLLGF